MRKNKYIRSISPQLIHYMNYIVLAYWIMGDGSKRKKGIILCTNGFTLKEIIILINILIIKFNINHSIQIEKKKYYRIYINGND